MAAAEPLYRVSQPDQLRLNAAWTLPGIRTKEFFRSCVIGLGMAAGHIGFVVLFYLLGSRVGVWAPQDIPYTDVLSTHFPWLYPADHRSVRGHQRRVPLPAVRHSLPHAA